MMTSRNVPLRGIADSTKRESAPPAKRGAPLSGLGRLTLATIMALSTWTRLTLTSFRSALFFISLLTLFTATWARTLSLASESKTALRACPGRQVFRLDLRALGFTVQQPESTSLGLPLEKVVIPMAIDPICFPSDGTVVVTFVTQNTPGGITHRNAADAFKPFLLHALFIDSETGKLRATLEWPSSSSEARVLPAVNGNFVVLTPETLTLYSPQKQPLKKLDLSLTRYDAWEIFLSPGRKALLVMCYPKWDSGPNTYQWIDTENLKVLGMWTVQGLDRVFGQPTFHPDAISNGKIVSGNAIRELGGPWRRLYSPDCDGPWQGQEFLNDETLFRFDTSGKAHFFCIADTDGHILLKQDIPPSEQFSDGSAHLPWDARPSADGKRFALPFYRAHGGSAFLDIPAHYLLKELMVYDLPSQRWIFRLDGKKEKIKTLSGLALSPDGSLMGLITQDGILEVYRVPTTTRSSK